MARAWNGHDPGFLRQQPGQRNLGWGRVLLRGDPLQQFHHHPVGPDRFGSEAGIAAANVVLGKGGVFVDLAGQVAAAQWAVRHKPDAEFLTGGQHRLFDHVPPDRVFALDRRDRLHRVGPADMLGAGLGQPEVLHLARLDQILDGPGHVFDRDLRIDPVLVEQVDGLDLEALERRIGHPLDLLRAAVQAGYRGRPLVGSMFEPEFGRDHHLSAEGGERLAHQFFVGEGTVDFRRVEKGDASFDRRVQKIDHLRAGANRRIAKGHTHTAQPERRNFQTAVAKFSCLHLFLRFRSGVLPRPTFSQWPDHDDQRSCFFWCPAPL